MKLRYFLLTLFLFLSVTPLLLFQAWPHSEVLEDELDEVHERHLLLARNLAAALERYYRDLVTTFDLLLDSPETWSEAQSMVRVLDNLSFRHVCIADWETGLVTQTLASASAPCPEQIPETELARLESLVVPDGVAFGPVVQTGDGENVLHMVKRLDDSLAVGAVRTTYFQELGEAIAFGVRGHAAIVDQYGRALSHPLEDWVASRKDMSQISAVKRMMARETGVEIFYSPALKGDMIAGFTFVDPVGWGVMIPQPIKELYEKADAARQSGIIVLIIGVAFALALALLVSLRVVRPLEQITRASSRIADGELTLPELQGGSRFLPVEFNELSKRFREMVFRLRENMSTINALAYQDLVTGLGNRTFLHQQLDDAIFAEHAGALMLIDLDGFKSVNDMYGHDVGDKVLEVVGARLCDVLSIRKPADPKSGTPGQEASNSWLHPFVTRVGGDEFAIWVPSAKQDQISAQAKQIVERIREPIVVDVAKATIGASVGIAHFPSDGKDRAGLMKAADLAMYDAKKAGKDRFVAYTPALMTAVLHERELGREIEAGLETGQFLPFFQPQFRLPDRSLSGVEALVRWKHPEKGLLTPKDFLETARELKFLADIDAMMLKRSAKLLCGLSQAGIAIPSLAVNISEERLQAPDFVSSLQTLGDLPFELRFELVETMALDNLDDQLAATLEQIREAGFLLDLDDFGVANASVLGLMNVEPSHIKIDRNLVSGVEQGNVFERLVHSIIGMGHSLGIPIIAEGADTLEQVERLAAMNCDFAQGFALAKPMGIDDLSEFLNRDAKSH
ncbi:EAL domain-containing protein [Labrenzia sp. DG1229]|uniref:putative bifunctional diguanylate cyclase/phosphodiesterase n=1 Tax=Labrenzia sp. DG1229 TaxID=681847 RepID=UPI0005606376|nr:EAL domain-containing protein [Labrenzia sp. DG1229]